MSVHYKFKSTLDFDTVSFDGLHISVADLKKAIFHQKRIGKNTDFDLQITNAQTKEDYTDDNALIAKNTSLIVARVPLTVQQKRNWERTEAPTFNNSKDESNLGRSVDLTRLDGSEEDKIRAMITQSTQDYDPSNYMKIRGSNQTGEVPPNYRCYKCHQPGHWIKNCPLSINQESIDIKKSTGIPRSFMVPVEGPSVPGAMMTPGGTYAVPAIDHQAYKEGKKERPPFAHDPEPVVEKTVIPEDLLCNICKDLLSDAVMIPCCGNSFCDECIRTFLLESEEHECPDCNEKDVSPESLIPNRYLRNAVLNFKNETGYAKRLTYKHPLKPKPQITEPSISEKLNASPSMSAATPAQRATAGQAEATEAKEADKPAGKASPSYEKASGETDGDMAKITGEDEGEVPPPPGTEPSLLPKRLSDQSWRDSGSELRDDDYNNRYARERRRSFSRDNNNHQNGRNPTYQNRVENNVRPGPRRRSLSPRNAQHPEYSMHQGHKNYPSHVTGDSRYHPGPMHYDPNLRRSTEDRAGTPTVDEPHLHAPAHGQPPLLPYPPGEDRVPAPPPPAPYAGAPAPPPPAGNPGLLPDPYMAPPRGIPMYPPGPPPPGPPAYPTAPPPRPHYDGRPPPPPAPYPQPTYRPNQPRTYSGGPPRPMRGMYNTAYRGMQPPPPGMGRNLHNGTAGVIDDPLEAFQRMLREKDERDRRMGKHRRRSRSPRSRSPRSYSRSRSRSPRRSRSPPPKRRASRTPPPSHRPRSRTPKKRRSRSGSFSISRYHKERDRDHKERPRSREPYSGYYGEPPASSHGEYRGERRYPARPAPLSASSQLPVSAQLLPPAPTLIVAAAGPQVPSSQPPPSAAPTTTLDRKDYYDSYNRYGGQQPARFASKRFDDVAPPGTEGYYDLPPPGVDHPTSVKDRPISKDKEADRYKDERESRHRGEDKSRSRGDRDRRDREYELEREGGGHRREHHERRTTEHKRKRSGSPYLSKHRSDGKDTSPDKPRKRDKDHDEKSDHSKKEKKIKEKKKKKDSEEKEKKKRKKKEKKAALIQKEAAAALAAAAASAAVVSSTTSLPVVKVKQEPQSNDEIAPVGLAVAAVPSAAPIPSAAAVPSAATVPSATAVPVAVEPSTPVVAATDTVPVVVKTEPVDDKLKPTQVEPRADPVQGTEPLADVPAEEAQPSPKSPELKLEQPPTETLYSGVFDEAEISTTSAVPKSEKQPTPTPTPTPSPPAQEEDDGKEEGEIDDDKPPTPKKDEFLAPVPELSKWERDETTDKLDEVSGTPEREPPEPDDTKSAKVVTTEVLKRAENAIFQKAINAIRPIEIKKISESRKVLYQNPEPKILEPEVERDSRKSVNVTITVNKNERSVELSSEPLKAKSKSERAKYKSMQMSPTRLSVKERLGEKIEDLKTKGETTPRSRSPKLATKMRRVSLGSLDNSPIVPNPERKVYIEDRKRDRIERPRIDRSQEEAVRTHERGESRKSDRATRTPPLLIQTHKMRKTDENEEEDRSKKDKKSNVDKKRKKEHRSRSKSRERKKRKDKKHKKEKASSEHRLKKKEKEAAKAAVANDKPIVIDDDDDEDKQTGAADAVVEALPKKPTRKNPRLMSDKKKSVLDEANFEPDYSASDSESDDDRSTLVATKRAKMDDIAPPAETETKSKKRTKPSSSEDDSSSSDSSSSESDSSVESHKKKKRKHKKKKKRKTKKDSSSDTDAYSDSSDSSSEEEKHRKKKKSKSKNKASKKKKKSKHK